MNISSNKLPDRDATEFTATEIRDGKLFESQLTIQGWQLYSKEYTTETISDQLFNALKEVTAEQLEQRRAFIRDVIRESL